MVQGHSQKGSRVEGGWQTLGRGKRSVRSIRPQSVSISFCGSNICRTSYEQWPSYTSEEPKLPGSGPFGREVGGAMLSVTGLNKIGFVSPERRYEAPGCCTAAAKVIIIMGKDAGFSWFPNRSVAINSRENRVKPLSNIYKQRLTVSKHATNETKYSVLRRVRAQRDCPRRHAFANYLI